MAVTQAMRGTGETSSGRLAVQTTGLTKRFGNRTVVDKVDLAIPAGSVCGFGMTAVENIIARIDPGTSKWLPSTALETVASGGTEGPSFSHGLIVAAVYLVVALIAAAVTFARADVTA